MLPAVRDQGSFNDCWAFASLGSLEFSLLPAVNDFSEDHLAVPAGTDFDYGPDGGGNYQMATAELARWNGPVAQASDPNDGVFVSGLPAIEHVQNVIFLPDRSATTDNDAIKAAVLTYGYSSKATTAAGRSYTSPDGSPGSWDDIGVKSGSYHADVCLKVCAGPAKPDTFKPATKALAAVKVVRGNYATLRYRVNDLTPHDIEKVTIRITKRSGKVVKSFTVSGCTPNTSLSLRFRCLLARAGYHYCVYTTDRWGNTQTSVGRAALTVR